MLAQLAQRPSASTGYGHSIPPLAEVDYHELSIGPRIGIGAFAEVFKGTWRGNPVAIKQLLPSQYATNEAQSEFKREVAMMK